MEIKVGDVFRYYNHVTNQAVLFKIIKFETPNMANCEVYLQNRQAGKSLEHRNTLLGKMQKLSSLEKELL